MLARGAAVSMPVWGREEAVRHTALARLERDVEKTERVARWPKAAEMVAVENRKVSREFGLHTAG
jgi:hypothetical protein